MRMIQNYFLLKCHEIFIALLKLKDLTFSDFRNVGSLCRDKYHQKISCALIKGENERNKDKISTLQSKIPEKYQSS